MSDRPLFADPARHGANVCVATPRAQAIVDALYAEGEYAWNGHGRARFSFHGYNAMSDVDRTVFTTRPGPARIGKMRATWRLRMTNERSRDRRSFDRGVERGFRRM